MVKWMESARHSVTRSAGGTDTCHVSEPSALWPLCASAPLAAVSVHKRTLQQVVFRKGKPFCISVLLWKKLSKKQVSEL